MGRNFLKLYAQKYETKEKFLNSKPVFSGKDKSRPRIHIQLNEITRAVQPTDIQFPPQKSAFMFVLEKKGRILLFDRSSLKSRTLLELKVLTASEEGLLGLSIHPDFPQKPLFYLNYNTDIGGKDYTRISEWKVRNPKSFDSMTIGSERVLLEVEQPYPNHNAGQLAFGSDKHLYIALGDGGWSGDPHNNSQNRKTMLGSMLRINPQIDLWNQKPYTIPTDNPFVGQKNALAEVYAYGLRNPWRYSFSPDGRLIAADVGQNLYEEIDIIESGKNYGWNQTEGFHCYKKDCQLSKYTDPIYEYGRDEGQSITGGYVYFGSAIPALKGKYVFGDFVSGRIWAIDLPAKNQRVAAKNVYTLGKWNILISTFGQDQDGEIFIGDFQSGKVFKISAKTD